MSNSRRDSDAKLVQLTLPLSELPSQKIAAGALRAKDAVKEALGRTLKTCGLSRELVADELSRLTGEGVSIHTLNNWAAPEKRDRSIPLEHAAALAVITGDHSVIQAAVRVADLLVLGPDEKPFWELGRMVAEDRERSQRKRRIMEQIKS